MLTCITRSMNDELYEMMLSLCPSDWKFIKVLNSTAEGYLDYIFSTKFETKWVLNLDEDCFLTNFNKIYELIKFMEENDYDYSGVQDGGSIPVRIHNPLVVNPFFNLFNTQSIFPLEKDYFDKKYNLNDLKNKYELYIRFTHSKYKYDFYEQFYSRFFWLLENGLKPYYMECNPYDKERYLVYTPLFRIIPYYNSPSMILDHKSTEIALHTWHSRYINHTNIRKRIFNCYEYALANKAKFSNKYDTITLNK